MNAPLPVSALAEVQALQIPDESSLSAGANAALRMAQTFAITSQDDYVLAADELKAVKAKHKALEERRVSITGPMNKALKAVNDLFRGPLAALEQAESTFKRSMLAWDQEQERIAAEERRKAEEAAAAERKRLADEAEALRKKAEEDAAALAKQAQAAASKGDTAAAEQAQQQAELVQQNAAAQVAAIEQVQQVMVAAPAVDAPVKVSGVSTAKTVDFEVVNLHELVAHIAKHPELINLVVADSIKLRAYVKGLGLNTNLPGVRVFEKKSLRAAA